MSKKILGLDIRNSAISAVLVKTGIKGNQIEAHAVVPLTPPEDADGDETLSAIRQALEHILDELDTTGAVCIASLPAEQVYFRNISIPFSDPKRIRQILPFELETTLPVPVEELTFDFQTIEPADSDSEPSVVTALVENTVLSRMLDLLTDLDIEPDNLTLSSIALANSLNSTTDAPDNFILTDIDNNRCAAYVVISGKVCFARSAQIPIFISSRAEAVALIVNQTLAAYEESVNSAPTPDAVYVTGSQPDEAEFNQSLSTHLDLPVRRPDFQLYESPRNPMVSGNVPASDQLAGALALTVVESSGLPCVNFRKGAFAPKKLWMEYKASMIRTAILGTLVLLVFLANLFFESYAIDKKIEQLDRQIEGVFRETFPEVKRVVDPFSQMQVNIQEARKSALLPEGAHSNVRTIDLLRIISEQIPAKADIKLTNLVIGPESLLISGNTDTFNSVDDMKNRLESVETFEKVTINSANTDRKENRVNFKLKVQL